MSLIDDRPATHAGAAATVSPPGGSRAPYPATPQQRSLVQSVALVAAGLGLGLVLAISLATRIAPSGAGAGLTELGRWTGLLGTYGALLIIVLVARIPWLERGVGQGTLMKWHRVLGPLVLVLIAAHVVLVTLGYAAGAGLGYLGQTASFLTDYPWMLPAMAGFVLMVVAGLTSWRIARRKMAYGTWWVTHLYVYLAIALAYLHQVMYGQQFVGHDRAQWVWIGLYVVTFGSVLVFRIGQPLWRSMRHDLRVHSVRRESPDTVSVIVQGRDLDRLAVRGGQYFGFRFLVRGRWWESHPYSVSAVPTDRFLRVTIKDLGDDSGAAATLRPGTRVVAEGPFGVFTATERRTDHVVLIGGGVGITPLRAMLDDLPAHVRIDVLLRARTADDVLFRSELDAIAATRPGRMRVHYLVGSRHQYPVTAGALRWYVPGIERADVFACGSADLVEAVRASAHELGIPADYLHHEPHTLHSPSTYACERAERTTS